MMTPMLKDMLTSMLGEATTQTRVLMIGGAGGPTSGDDDLVFAFLQAKFSVSAVAYQEDSSSVPEDTEGFDLLVISSTVTSSAVRGKFNTQTIPIINWEEALLKSSPGDFEFTDATAKPDTTDINVVDDTHPIMVAAGFSNGLVTIGALSERNCASGTIAAGVDVLAEQDGAPACKLVTVAEPGALDFNSEPFPAKRAMFPLTDSSFGDLNANGLNLFDATINWLLL